MRTAVETPAAASGWWRSPPARWLKVAVLLLLLVLIPPWSGNPYITTIFISAVMFGILGAIYDLMIGFAGLTNFGYAGFIAVGAYASALATFHYDVNPWLGLILGGLAGALLGLFTGVVTLRLRGLYLGLTTWFLAEAIRLTISNATDYTRGVMGLNVVPFPDLFGVSFARGQLLSYYYLLLILGAAILIAMALLLRSRVGLAFRAMREDELATQSLGLDTVRLKLLNFTLASAFTGVVGAFYCRYLGILTPTPEEFGVPRTVEILTIAYVGGRGTLWGSLFAAFLLIGLQEYFRSLEAWRLVIYGTLLITVILFLPKGLAGLRRYLW
ncbi:branched-chain amino acid ABC transporter permease [Benzoatithermus flavus]|uniref:Branched-chain amino acid ABC transporter permease n=1 Tax=Benzoatithermus flavus TaxID=3108223 RepID=A0ABU8XVS1_9PROT